jgi:hypothetical protein
MLAGASKLTKVLLCFGLVSVAGWLAPAAVETRGVRSSRRAVAPQMSEESNLAAEFQRLVAQRSGTLFGYPTDLLRSQGVDNSWVLIFNPGQEDEGVYTLQGRETPAKCHGTYVLSFERHEEASRFAMLLQAQGFDMPTATVWGVEQLSEFCSMAEFGLGFVPHDALLIPPQHNYFDANAFEKLQEVEAEWESDGAELRARLDRLFEQ